MPADAVADQVGGVAGEVDEQETVVLWGRLQALREQAGLVNVLACVEGETLANRRYLGDPSQALIGSQQ